VKFKSLKPDDDYWEKWCATRRLRRRSIYTFVFGFPATVLAMLLITIVFQSEAPAFVAPAVFVAAWWYAAWQAMRWPCPRCGKPFTMTYFVSQLMGSPLRPLWIGKVRTA
jgi:hypothetical protein